MIDPDQFRHNILRPALKHLNLYSIGAEELLILTMATESHGGTFIAQIKGPARGIFQMEPLTYHDLFDNYLNRRPKFKAKVLEGLRTKDKPPFEMVMYNLFFATQLARLFYFKFPEPLPRACDVEELAQYYKKYWNTSIGRATVEKAMKDYKEYIG